MSARLSLLVLLVLLALPATARGAPPDKQACADAATRGQVYRDDRKFASATEAFELCAQEACPTVVRRTCRQWLAELRERLPSIVVELDPNGPSIEQGETVRVRIDEAPADFGARVTVDPGPHTIRVEVGSREPIVKRVSLEESEHRGVRILLPEPPPLVAAPPPDRPVPPLFWLLGGVAVAGGAGFAILGSMAKSETDRLSAECAPRCAPDDRDRAFMTAAFADAALTLGVLAAAGATIVYFTRPERARPAAAFVVSRGGGALWGTF